MATGKGINCVILTEATPERDWKAFATWYTLRQFLPEAWIGLSCLRHSQSKECFVWSYCCKVPKVTCTKYNLNNPFLFVHDDLMMLRPLDDELVLPLIIKESNYWSEVKQDKFTPFVTYERGCGKFVMTEWLNKEECPFPHADSLISQSACAGELQVLKFWKQMNFLYFTISRR